MGSAEFFMPSYEITRVSEYIQYDLSYFITVLGSLNGVFSGGFALTWWFLGYSALQTLRTHLKLLDEAEHQPDKH
jgi:hypothetical protein